METVQITKLAKEYCVSKIWMRYFFKQGECYKTVFLEKEKMKSEFIILNEETKQIVDEIRDDVEEVSKYLDECEGMEDMIDKITQIIKKLDRVKWITNYNERLCKNFEG